MNPFDTACNLVEAVKSGRLASSRLVETCRERQARLGSRVNAIAWPDYDHALEAARRIDAAPAGSLAGLPVTIKDGIHVAGLPSTGGMIDPRQAIADADAPCVQRLRAAGAVILGKTNVPVANGDWQAVNKLFGRTLNPWNPALTSGGSTGGAAAIAAGLSAAELGSDIGGSIRIPAAFCGLFAHKPSATVVPNSGHFPWTGNLPNPALVLAAQGPRARSASDVERLFEVIAGPDDRAARGWKLALPPPRSESLAGCRVGLLRLPPWMPVESCIAGALQATAQALAGQGAIVRELDVEPWFGDFTAYYRDYLAALQCVLGGAMPPGARAKAAARMRAYEDPWLAAVADGLEGSAALLFELIATGERYRATWDAVLADVDIVLTPACSVTAFPHDDAFFYERVLTVDGVVHPYYRLSAIPALASLAGLPATVFPTAHRASTGAPIGLQAMGAWLDDRSTLAFARLHEQAFGGFQPPPGFD